MNLTSRRNYCYYFIGPRPNTITLLLLLLVAAIAFLLNGCSACSPCIDSTQPVDGIPSVLRVCQTTRESATSRANIMILQDLNELMRQNPNAIPAFGVNLVTFELDYYSESRMLIGTEEITTLPDDESSCYVYSLFVQHVPQAAKSFVVRLGRYQTTIHPF